MKKLFLPLVLFVVIFLQIFVCFPANAESDYIDNVLEDFELSQETDFQTINESQQADILSNKDSIIFDKSGNLKSIFRTNLLSEKYSTLRTRTTKEIPTENLITKTDFLVSKGYVPSYFVLENINDYDDAGYKEFVYLEKSEDNAINPYNSVKIAYDTSEGNLIYYNRINIYESTLKPAINAEQAQLIANEYLNSINQDVESLEFINLKVQQDDFLTLIENPQEIFYLVYQFNINGEESIISVDAITGTVLSHDTPSAFVSKSHYINDNINRLLIATAYNNVFNRLGYTGNAQVVEKSSAGKQAILNHIRGVNSWGFSFHGHGNPNAIGSSDGALMVYRSEISGIWSLVILDACSTATNDAWANAFQIYANNSLGRVFIGWNENVLYSKQGKFAKYFDQATGNYPYSTLKSNIYTAIANIPDNNTYYVRFIGDPNTTGRK